MITMNEDDKNDIIQTHTELCETIHKCWDDLPKNVQEKIYDMVYRHYEPLGINMVRRYGTIEIAKELWEIFWKTNIDIIPHRIEFVFSSQSYIMECECEMFRKLSEGDGIPRYMPIFKKIEEQDVLIDMNVIK